MAIVMTVNNKLGGWFKWTDEREQEE